MLGRFPVGRAKCQTTKDGERAETMRAMMLAGWDNDPPSLHELLARIIIPEASKEERPSCAEGMHDMISPANFGWYRDAIDNLDVMDILQDVKAPGLVVPC